MNDNWITEPAVLPDAAFRRELQHTLEQSHRRRLERRQRRRQARRWAAAVLVLAAAAVALIAVRRAGRAFPRAGQRQ